MKTIIQKLSKIIYHSIIMGVIGLIIAITILAGAVQGVNYNGNIHPNATVSTIGQNSTGQIGSLNNLTVNITFRDYCLDNMCEIKANTTYSEVFTFNGTKIGSYGADGVLFGKTRFDNVTRIHNQSLMVETRIGTYNITVATNQTVNLTNQNSFFIGGWFYTNLSGDRALQLIESGTAVLNFYKSGGSGWDVYYKNDTGQNTQCTTSTGNTNEWTHLIAVKNSSHFCLYVNGIKAECQIQNGNIKFYDKVSFGGTETVGATTYYDDIVFSKTGINEEKIKELYYEGDHSLNPARYYSNQTLCKFYIRNSSGIYNVKNSTLGYNVTLCTILPSDSALFTGGNNITVEVTPSNVWENGTATNTTQVDIIPITTQTLNITANSSQYNTQINTFNITIYHLNGSIYTTDYTTNGIISTITGNETYNISITGNTFRSTWQLFTTTLTHQNLHFSVQSTNLLSLYFTRNSIANLTNGYIADEEKIMNWTNSSLVIVQENLTTGIIHVRIGTNNYANATQYYEYYNDGVTSVNETIEILNSSDWYGYIQILDTGGNRIENAIVRADYAVASSSSPSWKSYQLLGQRLTDEEGYTFFLGDTRMEALYTISKSGYNPKTILVTYGDEEYTKASPLIITLEAGLNYIINGTYVDIPLKFFSRNLTIVGTITTQTSGTISYTTDYRESLGLSRKYPSASKMRTYTVSLVPNTDFLQSGTSNITLIVYKDDQWIINKTLTYIEPPKNILPTNTFDSFSDDVLYPLVYILIIIISAGTAYIINKDNIGVTTFYFTVFIFSFFLHTFWILNIIIALIILGHTVRKVISE